MVGFVVLVSLQALANFSLHQQAQAAREAEFSNTQKCITSSQRMVEQARSTAELEDELRSLQGPELNSPLLGLPLPWASRILRQSSGPNGAGDTAMHGTRVCGGEEDNPI